MDKFTAMILVVLTGIAVCMGVLIMDVTVEEEADTFGIEYDTGDATGVNPNPGRYTEGQGLTLMPMAYEDNIPDDADMKAVFGGWYLDPDFEELCMEIPADSRGDVKLYAKWQEDLVGRSITLSFSGKVHDGILNTYTLSGQRTVTYRFASEDRMGYYMTYDTSTTYDHGFSQYTETDSSGGWNMDDGGPQPQVDGYQTIDTVYGKKNCVVISYNNTRQWIGNDDGFVYRILEESMGFFSAKSIEYNLSESTVVPIVNEVDIRGYADEGITVTGSGTYTPTEDVVLTAETEEGYTFAGWYDAHGNLLANGESITVEVGWNDLDVFAMNDRNPDYVTETFKDTVIDLNSGAPNPVWSVCRYGTGISLAQGSSDTLTYNFQDTGLYEIFIEGDGYHGYRTLEIAGDVVRTFDWDFQKKHYTLTMTMDYDDVQEYRDMMKDKRYGYTVGGVFDYDHARQFVTYKDPYIQELASKLNVMAAGMGDVDKANFVLAFFQDIEYQSDEVYMGAEEYWKYPLETLYDKGGDCEDSSILYCAVTKAMGYDTALFVLPGHMMSGISVDGKVFGGKYVTDNGHRYYFVETTSDSAVIGQTSGNTGMPTYVIPIL